MPRLPTAADLGSRQVTRSNAGMATDRSGDIMADAYQGLGQTLKAIGTDMSQREDRFRYAKAKTELVTSDIDARRTLEDDNDFEDWERRYGESMTKALETASGTIRSKHDRAIFEQDAALVIERGKAEVARQARTREVDSARADLSVGLDALRKSGLNANDPATRRDVIASANDLINSAKEQRYITDIEAENSRQKWTADYAEGSIAMMDVEDAVAVLSDDKHPLNSYLQPDRRHELLEAKRQEFDIERVRTQSFDAVNGIMEQHHDRGDALTAARAINDPDVRANAVQDVNQRFNELAAIEREKHDQAVDKTTELVEGAKSTKGIESALWNELTVGEKQMLERRANQLAAGITPDTDWDLFYATVRQAADDPEAFQALNLDTLKGRLAPQEYQKLWMLKRGLTGETSEVVSAGLRTSKQIVDNAVEAIGISKSYKQGTARQKMAQQEIRFRRAVDDRLVALVGPTGEATPEQVQKVVDELTLQTVFLDEYGFDPEVGVFTVSEDQVGDAYVPYTSIPLRERTRLENFARSEGLSPSEEQIGRAYAAARLRLGDERILEALRD